MPRPLLSLAGVVGAAVCAGAEEEEGNCGKMGEGVYKDGVNR